MNEQDIKKLPCDIVRDLLPLYHDGIVSTVTADAVAEHLEGCEACRSEYQVLCEELPTGTTQEPTTKKKFLALMGRQKRKRIAAVIMAVVLTVAVISGIGVFLTQPAVLNVSEEDISVEHLYRFETEEGPRFFILYKSFSYGNGRDTWAPVRDTVRDAYTLNLKLKRTIFSLANTKDLAKTAYLFFDATAPDGGVCTAFSINGKVIWTEEENGAEAVPGYLYALYEARSQFFPGWSGAVDPVGEFHEDYVYIQFPDGREEYWDYDGNLLDGPMK
ncbi:MAG: zf-HC2 domain-containing protein [Oscillospiraceae bacterium]|nr:zf-HC2 domain-containing protein [Oscillospiraceae bacterium]